MEELLKELEELELKMLRLKHRLRRGLKEERHVSLSHHTAIELQRKKVEFEELKSEAAFRELVRIAQNSKETK